MAQRILVRPIGFALNSTRTQQFVRPFSTVLDTPVNPQTQQVTPQIGRKPSVFENAVNAAGPRNDWTREEITEVYNTPLIKLTYAAVCCGFPIRNYILTMDIGFSTPALPRPSCYSDVHFNEYQNWWL